MGTTQNVKVRSEQIKLDICHELATEPRTINYLSNKFNLTKSQINYHLIILVKMGYIETTSLTTKNKEYELTDKAYKPEHIGNFEIAVRKYAPKPKIHVYLNSKRPGSDYAWQRKKYKAGRGIGSLQSSMAMFD